MKNTILFILAFIISFPVSAEDLYENDFYFLLAGGGSFPAGPIDATANNYTLLNSINTGGTFAIFYNFYNKFNLHLQCTVNGYHYDIPEKTILANNPGFYLLEDCEGYHSIKSQLRLGIAYKINFNRFRILPYIDFAYKPVLESSFYSISLKEMNSNNRKKITTDADLSDSSVEMAFGADVLFHLGRHWGLLAKFEYDSFSPEVDFVFTAADSFGGRVISNDKRIIENENIFWSVGFFYSL